MHEAQFSIVATVREADMGGADEPAIMRSDTEDVTCLQTRLDG